MPGLDVRTVFVSGVVTFFIGALVMASLWHQHRKRFAGLGLIAANFAVHAVAMILISLRQVIPDALSIVVAHVLIVLGAHWGLMGLERFTGRTRPQRFNPVVVAVFAVVMTALFLMGASARVRTAVILIVQLFFWVQCVHLLLERVGPTLRPMTRAPGLVYAAFCVTNVVRLIHLPPASLGGDFMKAGSFDAIAIMVYSALFLLLTVSLVLMISRRLAADLLTQETKFATAFRSNPYGMTLTRLSDGRILEVNEGFEQIYGFARSEALGQTTRHLELWANPADRDEIVSELRRVGRVREREILFRKKSGETFDGLLSAELISLDDEPCILSTHSDITERKRLEEEIRQLSLLDALTNLRNRRGFSVAMEQLMKEARRESRKLHFIFLDADGLKSINDAHGHEEGDRALKDVANVLRKTFRDSDVIARLGGDEFCVCVMALSDPDSLPDAFLGRLRSNLDAAASQPDRPYRLSMSWGLATWDPATPKTLEEILADADAAMYKHKRAKRGQEGADESGSGPDSGAMPRLS